MFKSLLYALAAYFAVVAIFMLIAPVAFYETVPGVSETGPYNSHFVTDIGFSFLASAVALFLGAHQQHRLIAMIGAGFPVLHGGFHLTHWIGHGVQLDADNLIVLLATVVVAALTIVLVLQIKGDEA